MNSSPGPQKSESAWKLLHIKLMYVEFGATRACFVKKQDQKSGNRKFRNLEKRNRRRKSNAFYERVNRRTSREYNPIFDVDFASLVRYDQFPSLLYDSGATFLKIGLWYGGAASSFIPIFSVYIICSASRFKIFHILGYFSILRLYSFCKNRRWVGRRGVGRGEIYFIKKKQETK